MLGAAYANELVVRYGHSEGSGRDHAALGAAYANGRVVRYRHNEGSGRDLAASCHLPSPCSLIFANIAFN